MDLTSAFDTGWHEGLIYKLYSMNLSTTIIRWIIVTHRTTKIKFQEEFSADLYIKKGVPQGAALSPPYLSTSQNLTKLGLFADDTKYWTSARSSKSLICKVQTITKKFTRWCKTCKLQLN